MEKKKSKEGPHFGGNDSAYIHKKYICLLRESKGLL